MSQAVDRGSPPIDLKLPPHAALQVQARAWFEHLRDQICANFESIEAEKRRAVRRSPGRNL